MTYREHRKELISKSLRERQAKLSEMRTTYEYEMPCRGFEAKRHRNRRAINLLMKSLEEV